MKYLWITLLCSLSFSVYAEDPTLLDNIYKKPLQRSAEEETLWFNSLLKCDSRYVKNSVILSDDGAFFQKDIPPRQKSWAPLYNAGYFVLEPTRTRDSFLQTEFTFRRENIFPDNLVIKGVFERWTQNETHYNNQYGVYFKSANMRDYVMQELKKYDPTIENRLIEHNMKMPFHKVGLQYGWKCTKSLPKSTPKK